MLLDFRGNVTLRYLAEQGRKLLTRELGELSKQDVGPAFHNEPHILAHVFHLLTCLTICPNRTCAASGDNLEPPFSQMRE